MDESSPSTDYFSVVGAHHEDHHAIGEEFLAYFHEVATKDRGVDPKELERPMHRFRASPELVAILGYASAAQNEDFTLFSQIPEDQAILIEPHRLGGDAQALVTELSALSWHNNAPCDVMFRQVENRLCALVHAIRSAINRAKKKQKGIA